MKLITVIIIGVFSIASAIRVPTTWTKKKDVEQMHNKFRTTGRPSEIAFRARPHVDDMQKRRKINSARKHQDARHPNLKKTEFKASATLGDWKPIFPPQFQQEQFEHFPPKTDHQYQKPNQYQKPVNTVSHYHKPAKHRDHYQKVQPVKSQERYRQPVKYQKQVKPVNHYLKQVHPPVRYQKQMKPPPPQYRNYRDDRTHEPSFEEETVEEKHTHRESPHKLPLDVPIRPIYPGEGQWAKKGIKHRPYIKPQPEEESEEEEEEEDDRPEGYETFEKNQKLFERHRDRFRENINQFPQKHNLGRYREESDEAEEEDEEESESEERFVPIKLYTQVRRSEAEEHLPKLAEDPRLREVIKDSKIQTVYSEEGYEDLAYDHAGHEKTAEEDEGFSEFDREIEREKKRKGRMKPVKEDDSETAGSQKQSVKRRPYKVKKDKLMKVKEVKTTAVKDQDEGKEMEVVSEVKVSEDSTGNKTHKFVKIFPKVFRYDKENETTTTTQAPELLPMESRQKTYYSSRLLRRFKRYTNDYPKITVDTDFIDKINHNIPKPVQVHQKPKYPYYNDPTLHSYSPLRYAEDLENIPKKTEDDFAFYNQAEKIQCDEVQSDVNPVPARVKNADEDPENMEETSDVQELVQGPRLKNLGDKIDCFKIKYFGEDPLDSPFFLEKEVGPVIPLFNVLNQIEKLENEVKPKVEPKKSYSARISSRQKLKEKEKVEVPDLTILEDVVSQFHKSRNEETTTKASSVLKLEIVEPKLAQSSKVDSTSRDEETTTRASSVLKLEITEPKVAQTSVENQTEAATISIITTPKYTIDLQPKHIYHQIELLEYLPVYNESQSETTTTTTTTTTSTTTTESVMNDRIGKSLEETTETSPESQPLKHRRRRPRPRPQLPRPQTTPPKPYYQVFDVNKYLPQHTYQLLNRVIRTSTVVPRHSEVHYKEEIKPSEQLNVFADVINNIKNSSRDPEQRAASSNRVGVKINLIDAYRKIPVMEDFEEENLTTTTKAPRGTIKYSSYKTKEQLHEELANRDKVKFENIELYKVNRRLKSTTEPYPSETRISSVSSQEEVDEEEEEEEDTTEKVLGLMPPVPNKYTTIVNPKLNKPKMNLFYVLGMKPPSPKQKAYLYSDFKHHPKRKYPFRRGKRSAQRPAYSEVVRNRNKPIDVDDVTEVVVEEDDDYVPHRPKNYHYDEKTGRIVYDKVEKETEAPEEEYIEVTEAPLPKPTRRSSATTIKYEEITGPTYIDFVKQLKSHPSYQEIPDPPSTEKGEEVTTSTTTAKPVSTDPPAFLSILSKLKSDPNYKEIPDKTTKKTTTTEAPEEEEEEEEETQLENVKNSPGGQSSGQMLQIFDINDYLPKIKNYTPRTSIDYSKYKTIERAPPTRHNLSSRYNSDEENLENVDTSKVPILDKKIDEMEINPVMSESKHEDVEPSTTTTTTTTTTTEAPASTTKRIRTRTKNRGTRRSTTPASASVTTTTFSPPEETVTVAHTKPKRVYPRRRPTRIKVSRTTTEVPDTEVEESTAGKVIRRRHQKSETSPEKKIEDRSDIKPEETKYKVAVPTKEEINKLNRMQTRQNKTRSVGRKDADVQVFQKVDQSKRTGGSYRKAEESESKKSEVKRLTDVIRKPSEYYTDPKLPKKINQLMEGTVDEEEIEGVVEEKEEEADYDYEGSEEKTTTKKPVFVKDPDKRLYYYAPI